MTNVRNKYLNSYISLCYLDEICLIKFEITFIE